jgi:RNA polymerase sigma-70 factor (ECF subfamily)
VRIVQQLLPADGEVGGLLALMLLHDARRDARTAPDGEPVLLSEQDRSRWDSAEIADGLRLVERSLRLGKPGAYQLQAAIAALHAEAPTADATDWHQITALYELLALVNPSPVVELNHAAAVAMAEGPEAGLELMDRPELAGPLETYRWLHAARAELLRRLERFDEASEAYRRALELCDNAAERAHLERRLAEVLSS